MNYSRIFIRAKISLTQMNAKIKRNFGNKQNFFIRYRTM